MAVKVAELRALKAGTFKRDDGKTVEWLPDDSKRGAGTLLFRAGSGIVRGYFRFAPETGKRDTLAIGQWDEKGRDGMTLDEIRAKADEWRRLYQSGVKDIRAHLEAGQAAVESAKQAKEREQAEAERQAIERAQYTLSALCGAYVRFLEDQGKASAKHAKSMFKHVPGDLADLPANEIDAHQIARIVRQVRESGKERAAGILRSYLRAAFGVAIRAPFDSEAPSGFIPFNVSVNPVDAVPAIPVRTCQRALTADELRDYLDRLGDGIIDRALRLAVLAGGQRAAQLLRARVGDWDQGVLRLWDGKGKREKPREHLLPLGPMGCALVAELVERAKVRAEPEDVNPSLFLSVGKAIVAESTPGKRVVEIAAAMGGEPFDLRDIRRSVETQLAGLKVSRDDRAHLLSHGLSGIQNARYDRYSYMDEKRAALLKWERHLQGGETGSNVVEIRRRAGA